MQGLAIVLKDTLARLDVVLDRPAYNFMIHTSPIGEETNEHYHWHIEIIPKLTKVAGFGVGHRILHLPNASGRGCTLPARPPTCGDSTGALTDSATTKIDRKYSVSRSRYLTIQHGFLLYFLDSARYPRGLRERSAKPPSVQVQIPPAPPNLALYFLSRSTASAFAVYLRRTLRFENDDWIAVPSPL